MKSMKRSFFGILLSFAMMLTMMPMLGLTQMAYAKPAPVKYLDATGAEKECEDFTVVTDETRTFENGKWYVVRDSVEISDQITVSGTAHLILVDDMTLTADKGISVVKGNTLNIYAQSTEDNAGSLIATGNTLSSGIGGVYTPGNSSTLHCGTVIINGGNITANGDADRGGAGIGGGSAGDGGEVIINDGIVTANGGDGSAGIGSGCSGDNAGSVIINGGIVTAKGGCTIGAGIGGGVWCPGADVTINGGIVTAIGGINIQGTSTGPGIGRGFRKESHGELNIGDGIPVMVSQDGETWSYYDGETRPRYMKTMVNGITVNPSENGKLEAKIGEENVKTAVEGEKVTVEVGADEEYKLKELRVTTPTGEISEFSDLVTLMGDAVFANKVEGQYNQKLAIDGKGRFMIINGENRQFLGLDAAIVESVSTDQGMMYVAKDNDGQGHPWDFYVEGGKLVRVNFRVGKDMDFYGVSTGTLPGVDYETTTVEEGEKYEFTMPATPVTLSAEFEPIVTKYPVWVGKTQVTSDNMEDVLGDADEGKTVSFTPATKGDNPTPATLKLNGATISEDEEREGCTSNIYSKGIDLKIEVEGTNKIDSKPAADKSALYAIRVDGGDLTIDGGGSLDVNAYDSAIYLPDQGDCVINNGEIKATGETENAIHATGLITINGGLVNATSNVLYGIYGHNGVIINDGTVIATGRIGICNNSGYIEIKEDSNVEAYGEEMAIDGGEEENPGVKNEIAGTGWTDIEGTQGEATIAISSEGQSLNEYKKVRFPKDPEYVTVTLNYGEGHKGLFEGASLKALREATGALMVRMLSDKPAIDITFKDPTCTEAELRTIIDEFVNDLRGEEDWLIDNEESIITTGYKPLDEYKSLKDLDADVADKSGEHNAPINNDLTYHLLWAKPIRDIQLNNGNPTCGKEANTAKPTLPKGLKYYDDFDDSGDPGDSLIPIDSEIQGCYWEDEDGDDIETFEGGETFTCTANIQIDPEGELWKNCFDDNATKVTVKGGEIVGEIDADEPGLLIVKFKAKADHDWDEGKVTKKPTTTATGEKTYTCKAEECDATKTEEIPKLNPKPGSDPNQKGADGTPTGKGASAAAADKAITSSTSDEGPKGTKFSVLRLKSTKQAKTTVTLNWTKAKGATKYVVYGNACGKKNKMKKLVTLGNNNKFTVKKISKSLKKGTYHKFIVVALDKNNNVVSTSKVIHVATKGGKVGNPTKVTTKKPKALKKGKTFKLKAKQKGKKVKKHRALSYETSNAKVATVSKKGVIKAKGKGTCYVYAYAQNGVYKRVTVKVK